MTTEPRAEREGREWTAPVNGTGLRVEEVGSGTQTVVFPNAFVHEPSVVRGAVAALRPVTRSSTVPSSRVVLRIRAGRFLAREAGGTR